jgi:hypothetical protein
MALVADALRRLERPGTLREVYTEKDIPGLGRNILLEKHRAAAVRAYAEHLERFHLLRLLERATRAAEADRGSALARLADSDGHDIAQRLGRLPALLEAFAEAVERSKARDEERGLQIIDDYTDAHPPTAEDPVVRQTWDEVRRLQEQVATTLAATSHHETPRVALVTGG